MSHSKKPDDVSSRIREELNARLRLRKKQLKEARKDERHDASKKLRKFTDNPDAWYEDNTTEELE